MDEPFHIIMEASQEALVSPVLTAKQVLGSCTYVRTYASAGSIFDLLALTTNDVIF